MDRQTDAHTSLTTWLSVSVDGWALNCSMQRREEQERGRQEWTMVADVATPSTSTTGREGRWGLCVCV